MTPDDRKYADTHEWVKIDGDLAVIGLTDYAQDALGDITFVELPAVGLTVTHGAECGVVESVKVASDLFAPVAGEVDRLGLMGVQLLNPPPLDRSLQRPGKRPGQIGESGQARGDRAPVHDLARVVGVGLDVLDELREIHLSAPTRSQVGRRPPASLRGPQGVRDCHGEYRADGQREVRTGRDE